MIFSRFVFFSSAKSAKFHVREHFLPYSNRIAKTAVILLTGLQANRERQCQVNLSGYQPERMVLCVTATGGTFVQSYDSQSKIISNQNVIELFHFSSLKVIIILRISEGTYNFITTTRNHFKILMKTIEVAEAFVLMIQNI